MVYKLLEKPVDSITCYATENGINLEGPTCGKLIIKLTQPRPMEFLVGTDKRFELVANQLNALQNIADLDSMFRESREAIVEGHASHNICGVPSVIKNIITANITDSDLTNIIEEVSVDNSDFNGNEAVEMVKLSILSNLSLALTTIGGMHLDVHTSSYFDAVPTFMVGNYNLNHFIDKVSGTVINEIDKQYAYINGTLSEAAATELLNKMKGSIDSLFFKTGFIMDGEYLPNINTRIEEIVQLELGHRYDTAVIEIV